MAYIAVSDPPFDGASIALNISRDFVTFVPEWLPQVFLPPWPSKKFFILHIVIVYKNI